MFVDALFFISQAQQKDYKVVFDLTSKDTLAHQTAIRQMGLIARTNPDAKSRLGNFWAGYWYGGCRQIVCNKTICSNYWSLKRCL
jgi:hypothetical protein